MTSTRATVPVIEGVHVRLRPLHVSDCHARLALGRDSEYVRMNGGEPGRATAFTADDARRWYASFPDALRWAVEREGRLVGEARLEGAGDGTVRFAIGIFAPGDRDHGLGTETTRLVVGYAFERLAVSRIDLRVLAVNERAIHCYERCGFEIHRREHDRSFIGGRWHDDLLMRLTAEQYLERRGAWFGRGPGPAPGSG